VIIIWSSDKRDSIFDKPFWYGLFHSTPNDWLCLGIYVQSNCVEIFSKQNPYPHVSRVKYPGFRRFIPGTTPTPLHLAIHLVVLLMIALASTADAAQLLGAAVAIGCCSPHCGGRLRDEVAAGSTDKIFWFKFSSMQLRPPLPSLLCPWICLPGAGWPPGPGLLSIPCCCPGLMLRTISITWYGAVRIRRTVFPLRGPANWILIVYGLVLVFSVSSPLPGVHALPQTAGRLLSC